VAVKLLTVGLSLGLVACLVGIRPAWSELERADVYFLNEQQLPTVEVLGIAPSEDPWMLFEAFAGRFSIESPEEFRRVPHDIRRLAESGRGNRFALAFALLNLFRWNGIDTELVFVSTTRDSEHGDRYIERALVYVPALKQYFDPALPFDRQHSSTDRAWLSGRARMYFSAALQHKGKAVGRCPDTCMTAAGRNYRGGEFRVPNAVSVKTIRLPVTGADSVPAKTETSIPK